MGKKDKKKQNNKTKIKKNKNKNKNKTKTHNDLNKNVFMLRIEYCLQSAFIVLLTRITDLKLNSLNSFIFQISLINKLFINLTDYFCRMIHKIINVY